MSTASGCLSPRSRRSSILTFKDVKFENWEDTFRKIQTLLQMEYSRHGELSESVHCSDFEREYYKKVVRGEAGAVELTQALFVLSSMLHAHHKEAPILIVDEYDTPIQQGYLCGYYDRVILFMRNLFSGGLKDNSHLSYGFLTGILRVAKESIFSGMNNLKENSVLDERYSAYFGFTKEEITAMLDYYDRRDKYGELCEWYDGYLFGDTEIFNPWSVVNYMDADCKARAFWQFTGSNDMIRQIVSEATPEIRENLVQLMKGEAVLAYIDTSVIYPEVRESPSSIYSFLLMAGYLKVLRREEEPDGSLFCDVAIPDKELFLVYEKEILSAMSGVLSQSAALAIRQAVLQRNMPELEELLRLFLKQTVSMFDTGSESFYHGLMLGICAVMNNFYQIRSNRESGEGHYDIQMSPDARKFPGILMELKVLWGKNADSDTVSLKLMSLAEEALSQIRDKDYAREMRESGVAQILQIGIAFYKKQVRLVSEICDDF